MWTKPSIKTFRHTKTDENYYAKCNGFKLFTTSHRNTNHYCSLTFVPNLWIYIFLSWIQRVVCRMCFSVFQMSHSLFIPPVIRYSPSKMLARINTCQRLLCVFCFMKIVMYKQCPPTVCFVCQVYNKIIRTILFPNNCSLSFE